jgi:TonB family protein
MKRIDSRCLPALLLFGAVIGAADEAPVTGLEDRRDERVPLNTVAPAYPDVARRERIEGDVRVCFNVDRRGRPYRIAVRSSTNRVFEKPAIRAIRASRYQPVPKDQEVPGIKTCRTFRFRLESAAAD